MNYNKLLVSGRLTQDAEVKTTPKGHSVLEFSIAVETKVSADKTEVMFLDCALFGDRGLKLAQYLTKGKAIFVDGRLKHEKWETAEGNKKVRFSCVVDTVEFI